MVEIFLAPCSKDNADGRAYYHLQQTVVDGIDRSTFQEYTSVPDGEKVSVWGVSEGSKHFWDRLSPGDYLFFYIGDRKYKYAAAVADKESNPDFAEELWPDYELGAAGGDDPGDPWNYIIYLDDPVKLDLDSDHIHDPAGHSINYPRRFTRLNDQGRDAIINRYGSVSEFVSRFAVESSGESGGSDDSGKKRTVDVDEAAADLRPPSTVQTQTSRIIRNTTLSKEIKELYDHRCQVCGDQLQRDHGKAYAEAHHLHPLGAKNPGPDDKQNIIVLCPNHHADFDYGMIDVDPDSLELQHAYDEEIGGEVLTVHSNHTIGREFLEYHNTQISKVE